MWSIGIIIYSILLQKFLFNTNNEEETYKEIVHFMQNKIEKFKNIYKKMYYYLNENSNLNDNDKKIVSKYIMKILEKTLIYKSEKRANINEILEIVGLIEFVFRKYI